MQSDMSKTEQAMAALKDAARRLVTDGKVMRDSRGTSYYQHYNRSGRPAGIRRLMPKVAL